MSTKQSFIDAIAYSGKISDEEAQCVYAQYVALKFIRVYSHDGCIIKHGGLLDPDIIHQTIDGYRN